MSFIVYVVLFITFTQGRRAVCCQTALPNRHNSFSISMSHYIPTQNLESLNWRKSPIINFSVVQSVLLTDCTTDFLRVPAS